MYQGIPGALPNGAGCGQVLRESSLGGKTVPGTCWYLREMCEKFEGRMVELVSLDRRRGNINIQHQVFALVFQMKIALMIKPSASNATPNHSADLQATRGPSFSPTYLSIDPAIPKPRLIL
jgi:hypothetical protein